MPRICKRILFREAEELKNYLNECGFKKVRCVGSARYRTVEVTYVKNGLKITVSANSLYGCGELEIESKRKNIRETIKKLCPKIHMFLENIKGTRVLFNERAEECYRIGRH